MDYEQLLLQCLQHPTSTDTTLAPLSEPEQAGCLAGLAEFLRMQAEQTGLESDLNHAIDFIEKALSKTPDEEDEYLPGRLGTFASLLQTRFEWMGNLDDLDQAIALERRCIGLLPRVHPEYAGHLNNLSDTLKTRFEHRGAIDDLNEAISRCEEAVSMAQPNDPLLAAYLNNLSNALQHRWHHFGSLDDLDRAIEERERSLPLIPEGHPKLPDSLGNLGNALHKRFEQKGSIDDLKRAVSFNQQAAKLTPPIHPSFPIRLNSLGTVLHTRYDQTGSLDDLDDSIQAHSASVACTPLTFSTLPVHLTSLGNVLYARFLRKGVREDLDQAIRIQEQAVSLASEANANMVQYLNNLSNPLKARFNLIGSMEDLNRSIEIAEKLVDLSPDDYFELAMYLNNLGGQLLARFSRTEYIPDIDRAISMRERAVELTPPGHFYFPDHLSNLGITLLSRFAKIKDEDDIERALTILEQALSVAPASQPNYGSYFNNLGTVLLARAEAGNPSHTEIDGIVTTFEQADEYTPSDDPNRAMILNNLAKALRIRFERTRSQEDFEKAVNSHESALDIVTAGPRVRIAAAKEASDMLVGRDIHHANRILRKAILLLPSLTPRDLQPADQQHNISEVAGLTAKAVAVSLECDDDPYSALELLELGRGILVTLQLEVKSDISALLTAHPEIGRRFEDVRNNINQANDSNASGERRRSFIKEFDSLLSQIRNLEGFTRFLLGPSKSEMLSLAEEGPIIVFNVDKLRSDAIIVTNERIRSLRLPLITHPELVSQVKSFQAVLRSAAQDYSDARILSQSLKWLWDAAVGPILDELELKETPANDDEWTRVWWVNSGVLGLFPIHAAGYHDLKTSPMKTAIDRVVSSYSPTVKALAYARKKGAMTVVSQQKALLVGMPKNPDHDDLPAVNTELSALEQILRSRIPTTIMLDPPPTKALVLSALRDHHVVHMACHGISMIDPSKSYLVLKDWKTDPLRVSDLISMNILSGLFAYLSACNTANTRNLRLLDESINIASSIHLSGYPSVVGTLWTIDDRYSAQVAKAVYSSILFDNTSLNPTRAAEGLHKAVRELREVTRKTPSLDGEEVPSNPLVWAPYMHLGV